MYRAYEMKLLANNKKLKIIDSILIEYKKQLRLSLISIGAILFLLGRYLNL